MIAVCASGARKSTCVATRRDAARRVGRPCRQRPARLGTGTISNGWRRAFQHDLGQVRLHTARQRRHPPATWMDTPIRGPSHRVRQAPTSRTRAPARRCSATKRTRRPGAVVLGPESRSNRRVAWPVTFLRQPMPNAMPPLRAPCGPPRHPTHPAAALVRRGVHRAVRRREISPMPNWTHISAEIDKTGKSRITESDNGTGPWSAPGRVASRGWR